MTCYFEPVTESKIGVVIAGLERCSFHDDRDGCRVVMLGCTRCSRPFSEELGVAKEKVRDNLPLLCLDCDPEAEVQAFRGLTIKLGWF